VSESVAGECGRRPPRVFPYPLPRSRLPPAGLLPPNPCQACPRPVPRLARMFRRLSQGCSRPSYTCFLVRLSSSGLARVLPVAPLNGPPPVVDRSPGAPAADPFGREGVPCWEIPFVGRAAELRRLRTAFESARRGHGRAVLLVGDHGI